MADHRHKDFANAGSEVPQKFPLPIPMKVAVPIAAVVTAATVGAGVFIAAPNTNVATEAAFQMPTSQATINRDEQTSRDASRLAAAQAAAEAKAAAEARAKARAEARAKARAEAQAARQAERAAAARAERRRLAQEARLERQALRREAQETAKVVAAAERDGETMWTTEELNLWTRSDADGEQDGTIAAGEEVVITGRAANEREEIVVDGASRWVSEGYLAEEEPVEGIGGECTNGTSVPGGVSANIKLVHQAVCAKYPEITSYGTLRSDGEHSQGLAIDIMVTGSTGDDIAEFLRANYAELGINYIIWEQKIWSVQRSSEGWRGMEDRGSVTANHYDHVHVTTY